MIVPLATLQHRADRAGDSRLLGPIDPALARALAAAAARSPASRWEITVVDDHGYATGHGTARPARGARPQPSPHPQPPPAGLASCALPARVNITITETFLHHLETQAALPRSGAPPPGAWQFTPRQPGTWVLTLPGGRPLAVRLDVVPTHDCDHRYAVSSYLPGDRLRRLIQVRDHTCTWPPCSRPARESDFEHAIPYDKGGVTDACNAGAAHEGATDARVDHPAHARLARMETPTGQLQSPAYAALPASCWDPQLGLAYLSRYPVQVTAALRRARRRKPEERPPAVAVLPPQLAQPRCCRRLAAMVRAVYIDDVHPRDGHG